jgi:outer membrane receptor protein involved in Fe transport
VRSSSVPIDFILNPNRWQQATAQFIYQVSPAQLLEVRPGLMRSKSNEVPLGGVPQSLIDLGVSKELGIVVQQGTGDTDLFVSTSGGIDAQTIPQVAILHTWTRGGLTLRSGAELRRLIVNQANVFGAQPVFTFQGYLGRNGLLGESASQPQAITATSAATVFGEQGGPRTALRGVRSTQQEYYAQADWRLRRDVTLNLGLRATACSMIGSISSFFPARSTTCRSPRRATRSTFHSGSAYRFHFRP